MTGFGDVEVAELGTHAFKEPVTSPSRTMCAPETSLPVHVDALTQRLAHGMSDILSEQSAATPLACRLARLKTPSPAAI